ncbi:S1 family peptidase [Streptomyces sp. NPDC087844]|uniref:S1 family peptidase n=1 Tax=Streptomyces sp. NPDC087844 TaxID=3365805 RepID=UPI003811E469
MSKRTKVAAAGLTLVAVTALVVVNVDSAENSDGKAGPSSAAASASATPLLDETVAAVAKNLHVSKDQAGDRLVQQAEMLELNTTVKPTLDDSWSAGTWLDRKSGNLVVAVTNERRAAEVRARDAEPRLVERSAQDLRSVRSRVEQLLSRRSVEQATTFIDVTKNVVVIQAQQSDLPGAIASELDRTFPGAIDVRYRSGRIAPVAIASGDEITGSKICSAGWWVRSADARQSKNYVMTAGHCVVGDAAGQTWRHADGEFGPSALFRRDSSDWALIPVADEAVADQLSATVPAGPTTLGISRVAAPESFVVGSIVCKRGRTTSLTCGRITAHNASVPVDTSEAVDHTLLGVTTAALAADEGDSGGPVFVLDPRGNDTVVGIGIASVSTPGKDPANDLTIFQSLPRALAESGTVLVTDPASR